MTTLLAKLARNAAGDPRRIALVDGERRASYGELWDAARRFAAALAARGVGAGDRVAVLLPNSLEAVAACYGTWLARAPSAIASSSTIVASPTRASRGDCR